MGKSYLFKDQWIGFVGENLHRKPEWFSHEDHGVFRWKFSRENQSIDLWELEVPPMTGKPLPGLVPRLPSHVIMFHPKGRWPNWPWFGKSTTTGESHREYIYIYILNIYILCVLLFCAIKSKFSCKPTFFWLWKIHHVWHVKTHVRTGKPFIWAIVSLLKALFEYQIGMPYAPVFLSNKFNH